MAYLTPSPKMQFFTANGIPLVGGKLYTYESGTTTPATTYVDQLGSASNPNPVIMDSRGEAGVWLANNQLYTMVLKDSLDNLIWTSDGVGSYEAATPLASTFKVQNFSGDGTTVAFVLDYEPPDENNTQIYINGAYQQKNTYSLAAFTITFSSAPPLGTDNIEVMTIATLSFGYIDSSLVNYVPAGTGAVATTVQAKLRESVSVLDFYLVTDPDSTGMFQRAATTGKSFFVPAGTYIVNGQITLAKGQNVYGDGRNLTLIEVPDAYAGVVFMLQQGCGIYDLTLTRPTVGTYNANGTAIQVDGTQPDCWNTRVQNVLIQNFNIADNIANYRHTRDEVMYFYNRYGTVVNYDSAAAGSTLIVNCAYLYTYVCGLTTNLGTTHTQVKATTFEFAGKHIQNDGVLYIDSCYISDQGAFNITGTGRVFLENGHVTPFQAGAVTQGSEYGYDFVNTDNEYCVKLANGVLSNVAMGIEFQFITGQPRRGAVLGAGNYVLNNCSFVNSASGGPSPYLALYPLEYSSTINQQISSNSTKYPNYITNGLGLDRDNPITGATVIAERNAWGGGVQQVANPASMVVPFSIPAGTYTLGDPLMLMVYVGTATGSVDIYLNGLNSVNILVDETSYATSTFRQFASEPVADVFRAQTGNAYGTTYNVALTCLIVKCSALTGTFDIALPTGATTAKVHAVILTPVVDAEPTRVIGWFENP